MAAAFLCWLIFRSRRTVSAAVAICLAVCCTAVGTEHLYRDGNLKISVLGRAEDCVLVISQGNEAVVIDMSGSAYAAAYVNDCLTAQEISSLKMLCLVREGKKSTANYSQQLALTQPEIFRVLGTAEEAVPELFGQTAQVSGEMELLFHGAVISAGEGTVTVDYAGISYLCSTEYLAETEADILTVYGKSRSVLPESGLLLVLDGDSCYTEDDHTYVGENNLELTIASGGECRVRRLYADS
jgi:hypothetical protein